MARRFGLAALALPLAIGIALAAQSLMTGSANAQANERANLPPQARQPLENAAKQANPKIDGTSIITFRDLKGNEVEMNNSAYTPNTYQSDEIEIEVDLNGFSIPGKTITKVEPSVTIYSEGSNCVTVCKGSRRPTCTEICVD
jgi:hypothetical protein